MGLAGTKNKKKWAKDPNNTAWSRNADTFGQKIMRSQGWAPGEYLGARDASHSEFYSAANASHIRAVMKDDNMGLGARRNQGDECTGLDALQDLLSRLNGRSDEAVGEERRKREDTKINKYLSRKVGTMRFVSGGLLVGDKVQELADSLKEKDQAAAKVPTGLDGAASEEESAASAKKEKKSKKRKSEDEEDQKKSKKSKKRKTDDADEDSKSKRKDKKDKKDKKRRKERGEDEGEESSPGDADDASAARKKSKKEKKEKRRKAKGDDEDDEDSADASDPQSRKKEKKKRRKADNKDDGGETTKSPTPAVSAISTPTSGAVPVPHRHLARSRFIAQKRAAVMDQAALNQIFMIKA